MNNCRHYFHYILVILCSIFWVTGTATVTGQTAAPEIEPEGLIRAFTRLPFQYQEVPQYTLPNTTKPDSGAAEVRMYYARSYVYTPQQWEQAKRAGAKPHTIDLVYTKYPLDTADWITPFTLLMTARMRALYRLDPSLEDPNLKWNLIAQTAAKNGNEARQLFHGFVIHYTPNVLHNITPNSQPQANTTKTEDAPLQPATNPATNNTNPQAADKPNEPITGNAVEYNITAKTQSTDLKNSTNTTATNITQPTPKPDTTKTDTKTKTRKRRLTDDFDNDAAWSRMNEGGVLYTEDMDEETRRRRATDHAKSVMVVVKDIINGNYTLQDSVVYKVLERKPEWNNLLVVMDWTGSMYPYGAQVVRWHKVHIEQKRVRHIVVFNDGDDNLHDRMFRKKTTGETGGIYYADPNNIEDVLKVMEEAVMNGDGGEIPENNIEAILKSWDKYAADSCTIVMIADNAAPVRDITLTDKVPQPVNIILCGVKSAINPDYVTIAWKTGGSLHTHDQSITFTAPREKLRRNTLKIKKDRYALNEIGNFRLLERRRFLIP